METKPIKWPDNPCVGWAGPCPRLGDDHGCMRPGDHESRHVCPCGDTIPPTPRRTDLRAS